MKKKILRVFGFLLIAVSLFFVFRNIWTNREYLIAALNIKVLFTMILYAIHSAVLILVYGMLYKRILKAISGECISNRVVALYTESSFYKYLPGNVMQYVGRNRITAEGLASFSQVNMATAIEIIEVIIVTGVIAIAFSGPSIYRFLGQYIHFSIGTIILCAVLIIIVLAVLVFILNRRKPELLKTIKGKLLKLMLFMIAVYIVLHIIGTSILALILMSLQIKLSIQQVFSFVGGSTGAWMIGFFMPGVPGGIGVREAAMNYLLSEIAPAWAISVMGVLSRVSQVVGEFAAFLFVSNSKRFK